MRWPHARQEITVGALIEFPSVRLLKTVVTGLCVQEAVWYVRIGDQKVAEGREWTHVQKERCALLYKCLSDMCHEVKRDLKYTEDNRRAILEVDPVALLAAYKTLTVLRWMRLKRHNQDLLEAMSLIPARNLGLRSRPSLTNW